MSFLSSVWKSLQRKSRTAGFWFSVYVAGVTAFVALGVYVTGYDGLMAEAKTGPSAVLRNLGLLWGGFIALGLALWRSRVAERQAETARRSLLNDRYQRSVDLLGNERLHIRTGAIHALKDLAFEDPKEFGMNIATVLLEYSLWAKVNGQPRSLMGSMDNVREMMDDHALKRLHDTVTGKLSSDGVDFDLAHKAVHAIVEMLLNARVIDTNLYNHVMATIRQLRESNPGVADS